MQHSEKVAGYGATEHSFFGGFEKFELFDILNSVAATNFHFLDLFQTEGRDFVVFRKSLIT